MLFESDIANILIPIVVLFALVFTCSWCCTEKFCFHWEHDTAIVTGPRARTMPVAQIPEGDVAVGIPLSDIPRGVFSRGINTNPMASAPSFSLLGGSIIMPHSRSFSYPV